MTLEPSGAQWCARFPTSVAVTNLAEPFRSNVIRFIEALRAGGLTEHVAATWRPAPRAWLMHWCCMIADSGQDPAAVPPLAGVAIDWAHGGDIAAARAAARAMKAGYGIAYPAALVSRHTQRRAIDMTVRWSGSAATVRDARGTAHIVRAVSDLWPIGRTFGVIKLESDPPHWSDDGH